MGSLEKKYFQLGSTYYNTMSSGIGKTSKHLTPRCSTIIIQWLLKDTVSLHQRQVPSTFKILSSHP